jgi:isocitrate/isopropylmalate dehydrogenase
MTTPEKEGMPPSVAVQIRKIFDLYANVRPAKVYPR